MVFQTKVDFGWAYTGLKLFGQWTIDRCTWEGW